MAVWLVLVVVIVVVVHLTTRLRALETHVAELRDAWPAAPDYWGDSAPRHDVPAPDPEPAPPPVATPPEPAVPLRRPAVVIHSQLEPPVQADQPAPYEPGDVAPMTHADDAPDEGAPRAWTLGIGFEELFGRRLPIWAGGITLAVAGMLIVKLSIDSGLITPPIRVLSGLIFGALLIGGAEFALRYEEKVRDPRVRQALAGAGVASLYASVLIAVNLYHLIAPLPAMIGMAGITALAMFLAIRFGAPSALLGLAGGLAAPALVGSNAPNVPLLSVYLALAVAGLCTLSRNQRWAWLGISALVGGFGWGVILLVGGVLDAPSTISLGVYLLLLGVGIPALGFAGDHKHKLQLVSAIAAAAQMAALVATGGFALTNWGLFALLAIASLWLARRNQALVRLPAVGLVVVLLLLGAWPAPAIRDFTIVILGFAVIYATPALLRLWTKGGLIEAAEVASLGLGGLLLPMLHFHRADGSNDVAFGLLANGLALAIAACAALGWRHAERRDDARFAMLATVAGVLAAAAALLLLPIWLAAAAIGAIGIALLHLGQVADDRRLEPMAWIFAAAGLLAYPFAQVSDSVRYGDRIDATAWALQAAIAALFAWRGRFAIARGTAQFLAPALLCFALTLVLVARAEPLIAPVLVIGVAGLARWLGKRLVPALASCTLLILGWAAEPLVTWSGGGLAALFGSPMLLTSVPAVESTATHLLLPGLALAAAVLIAAKTLRRRDRLIGWSVAGILAVVGTHSLYKHAFAISAWPTFVARGLAERTVWEAALIALAFVAYRFRRRPVALVLAAAAAAHVAYFTLFLHNPLWAEQAVGAWPVINLVLPAYALAFGLIIAAKRLIPGLSDGARRGLDIAQMVLLCLFVFSELRQLFHGALLVSPGLPMAEDILRSILAIALALGFLLWGIARRQRVWRFASLALMLGAVGKVFLFDASGLEGVTRIASFVALGLSLIGIGWLYSRYLGADRGAVPEPA